MSSKVSNLSAEIEMDGFNSQSFVIESLMKQINTIDLVKVVAINDNGLLNVQPIVANVNNAGEPLTCPVIYNVRYVRWQAGVNSVIMTPQVGDIGLFCICHKDISNAENGVVATYRKWNYADGIYLGGINGLNQAPTTSIEINTNITITGTNVTVNATKASVIASEVNLGGEGGQGVARIGDSVDLSTAKIIGGSTVVKAI